MQGEDRNYIVQAEVKVMDDLDILPRVRTFVREICQDMLYPPMDDREVGQLELAVNEAMSNVIIHACEGRANREILVEIEVLDEHVSIQISHTGKAFEPPSSTPAFDGSQGSGFGLSLISLCVDDVWYVHREQRNYIRLVKGWTKTR